MLRSPSRASRRPAVAGGLGMLVGVGLVVLNLATPPVDRLALVLGVFIALVGLTAFLAAVRS